jgi:hypothetical protein
MPLQESAYPAASIDFTTSLECAAPGALDEDQLKESFLTPVVHAYLHTSGNRGWTPEKVS